MDALLKKVDEEKLMDDDCMNALKRIKKDTIDKVFAGKVFLTTTIDCLKWSKYYFQTHKSLLLGRIYHR